jgi:hypothetical protein
MGEPEETGASKRKKPAKETSKQKGRRGSPKEFQADVVEEMINRFKRELKGDKVKMTVGDFIRLVQLREELEAEEPKEIRVTWVEPTEKESANET